MIYKEVFDLRGTELQQQIVIEALDAIKFPFEKVNFPRGRAIIGWANLNGQAHSTDNPLAVVADKSGDLDVQFVPVETVDGTLGGEVTEEARGHTSDHPASDANTEPLMGEVGGRKYTLGVFYPSSGNIYIDNALVNYPEYAKTTVSAEVAHGVDEFLPMTDAQRQDIIKLVHDNDPNPEHRGTDHVDRWWELNDYSAEYYSLIGESFMIMFTYAYSDLDFEGATDFYHEGTTALGGDIRRIIGIERTDYVEPIPPMTEPELPEPELPTPPVEEEPIVEPELPVIEEPNEEPITPIEEPITPEEESPTEPTPDANVPVDTPEPDVDNGDNGGGTVPDTSVPSVPDSPSDTGYVRYGKSKVYHVPTHYEKKKNGVVVENTDGLRLCKICQKSIDRKLK
jgi:hypothetical protein